MAYFPNGASGDRYMEQWCDRCVNWKPDDCGEGCIVWDLHMIFDYDQCKDTPEGKLWKTVLEHFIPTKKPEMLYPDKCRMFLEKPDADCVGQEKFDFARAAKRKE